tara:strand:- start:117991 stop:118920 length:930 start_codon:yes stop_codon:yes gene_type:complete
MPVPLRLIFAGSPAAAVPSLEALIAGPHDVVAVVTREDSPQGRKRVLTPTPVAELAEREGIPVIRANRLGSVTEQLTALDADLGVIVAYGGLIREPLLHAPRHGWINLHFSLLPKWRGAAPVQRAIMAGDTTTGTAVFQLVEELDAGPVFAVDEVPITPLQTAGNVLEALALSGARQLATVVDDIASGRAQATEQSGEPSAAPKLRLEDGRIDWNRSAELVSAHIRGVTPEPGAFTEIGGDRLKVLEIAPARDAVRFAPGELASVDSAVLAGTATDPIELVRIQPAGRKPMRAADWWRGRPVDAEAVAS